MIRPAKCYFNGFIKPFIKGADKNHNPCKGTETIFIFILLRLLTERDKNHNPRKGTETASRRHLDKSLLISDKNHNPRKGTGKKKAAQSSQFPLLGEC